MTPFKVALIDDDPGFLERMATQIRRTAKASGLAVEIYRVAEPDVSTGPNSDAAGLNDLLKELGRLRSGDASGGPISGRLESADVILVDFDLRGTQRDEGLVTGERVIQLIRLYLKAGPLVSLDRRLARIFDLSHRRAQMTNADYILRAEDLDVRSLFGGSPSGYDPWYWPNLVETSRNYRRRVEFVEQNYKRKIVESLDIPTENRQIMPGEDSRLSLDFRYSTFAQIAEASLPREPRTIKSGSRHRMAASIVGTWLQSTVLPPQDILIDAPHLVRHCPSLFRGQPTPANLAKLAIKQEGAKLPFDMDKLSKHRLAHGYWLDRPAWWLASILQDRKIKDIEEPFSKKSLSVEFAEDDSRFHRRADLATYESEGFFASRYVVGRGTYDEIDYEPRGRLAA